MENLLEIMDKKSQKMITKNIKEAEVDWNAFADETEAVIQK